MPKRPPPVRAEPGHPDAAVERAAHAVRTGRLDEAERLAAEVLKSDPGNVIAAQALGHALLMQDRPAAALEPLRGAARLSGDPATETLLARTLAAAGCGDEALDQLRRTTERRPAFPLAFLELGDQLGRIGRFDEAVAAFERGLALRPDALVLRMGLGRLCLQRNHRARARRLFAEVRAAAPQRYDALAALAKVVALDGDYAAAADLHRLAITLRPDDPTTRIELGKCLLELGERQAGEAMLRAVAGAAPGLAVTALAATPHGRFFLRPSAAARFLGLSPEALAPAPPA